MLKSSTFAKQKAYLQALGVTVWTQRSDPLATPQQSTSPIETIGSNCSESDQMDWYSLRQAVEGCQRCALAAQRQRTVFGTGDQQARWLLVGEAPGAQEDKEGLPFVGPAGQLLNAMLQAMGLARQNVYIANVLKCRPPGNRDPLGEECRQCLPYLSRQIQLLQPAIILAMGRFAAQALLQTTTSIGLLRGLEHQFENSGIPLVVTYHPAYLLRSPLEKRKAWTDLQLALRIEQKLAIAEQQ